MFAVDVIWAQATSMFRCPMSEWRSDLPRVMQPFSDHSVIWDTLREHKDLIAGHFLDPWPDSFMAKIFWVYYATYIKVKEWET